MSKNLILPERGLENAVLEHLHKAFSDLPHDLVDCIQHGFDALLPGLAWDGLTPIERRAAAKHVDDLNAGAIKRKRQREEKKAAGRYTLDEAAQLIADSGERIEVMQKKLCTAAQRGDLTTHAPGERSTLVYDSHSLVHSWEDEAYWCDLNEWLSTNEPRITFRFAAPAGHYPNPAASPTDPPTDHAQFETPMPMLRQQHQEDEILRAIRELGYEPTALPVRIPGKRWIKSEVRAKLRSFTDRVFNHAWDRLRQNGEIREA
ncbi:hypothetical protein PQQ65_03495 [Paraburkholderia strydomiana]|uniref:hypothetical protein n=1 Tax=Paraburkholderia strydomiana TaxID=1245417 RepID=UPI0038BBC56C